MAPKTVEVHPRVIRNATIVTIGCAAFTILVFWILLAGESAKEIFVGLLCIMFFGGGGFYSVPKLLRRKVPMVLAPHGLEQRYAEGTSSIPWGDIERVGIVSIARNKMVGIRLKTYDHYLDSMSPSLAEFITKSLPYARLLSRATSLLDVPTAVRVWSKVEGHDLKGALHGLGKVGSLAQALLWAREQFGYDLVFSWVEIDRPARDFVTLLEGYLVKRGGSLG